MDEHSLIFFFLSVKVLFTFSRNIVIFVSILYIVLGCVRLTLFQNKNTYIDDNKIPRKRFLELLEYKIALNYHVPAKICRNVFLNLLKKRNLTAIPLSYSYSGIRSIERSLSLYI